MIVVLACSKSRRRSTLMEATNWNTSRRWREPCMDEKEKRCLLAGDGIAVEEGNAAMKVEVKALAVSD